MAEREPAPKRALGNFDRLAEAGTAEVNRFTCAAAISLIQGRIRFRSVDQFTA
jgi:hypothetical protein